MFTTKKFNGLFEVAKISGVPILVHWSVCLIAAVMLAGAVRKPLMSVVAMTSYLSILVIHECGHAFIAKWKHCAVHSIELYPIHGRCCFEQPWTKIDHCVIAWGGVIAQLVVAIPLVAYIARFGYPSVEELTPIFALLGGLSLIIAAFNLIPVRRLDGVMAWQLFPLWLKERRKPKRPPKNPHGFRTY